MSFEDCKKLIATKEELELLKNELNDKLKPRLANFNPDTFLLDLNPEKNPTLRLFAYLLKFNIISSFDNIGEQIVQIVEAYQTEVQQHFPQLTEDPLNYLSDQEEAVVVTNDLPRSKPYFQKTCEDLGIETDFLGADFYMIKRMLVSLSLSNEERLSYTQGFDRLVFNSYALSLFFAFDVSIHPKYAEGISVALTKRIIYMVNMDTILSQPANYYPLYLLNYKIYKIRPDVAEALAQLYPDHAFSIFFALKWRLLLFADDHEPKDVFLIFDQFVMRQDDIDRYFFCLALAHVKQVQYDDPSTVTEHLQDTSTVNVIEAIKDANLFYGDHSLYVEDESDIMALDELTPHKEQNDVQQDSDDDEIGKVIPEIAEKIVTPIAKGVGAIAGAAYSAGKHTIKFLTSDKMKGFAHSLAKKSSSLFNPFHDDATPD